MRMALIGLALASLMGSGLAAQGVAVAGGGAQPPTQSGPPTVTTAAPDASARVFGAAAGVILNAVRPDSTDDFEMVLGRLADALATSPNPVRRQQSEGWRVFRASEAGPNASVLYLFVVDPVVLGADYGVARILAEAFPDEAGSLYALYSGAFVGGQTLLNLESVGAFDDPLLVSPTLVR
jgi:hypothetical protein